jgi:hypothetical protein
LKVVLKIRKRLTESRQGWTIKQVNDIIVQEGGIKYHYVHIYRLLHKWGFKQKVPRKIHVITASKNEKDAFKKEHRKMLDNLPKGFTTVSLDESFFFFDSFVRKMWIQENARPVVTVTGSHRHFCMFGTISLEGKQLFKQYDRFNENTFYEFLKLIHYKFPKCYLFLDKARQHYKSQKIKQYLQKHKQDLIPIWLPTSSPEFMIVEECWNISRKTCWY